jgi:hypothetical protein
MRFADPSRAILNRFPVFKNILPVYGLTVFLVYSWTLLVSTWRMPSWLLFMTGGEILIAYAYAFVVNFLESLVCMAGLLSLSWILPARFFKDDFAPRASAIVLIVLGSAMIVGYTKQDLFIKLLDDWQVWWGLTALIALVGAWLAARVRMIGGLLENISDRTVLFLYLYLPLTFISILAVLWRNLF